MATTMLDAALQYAARGLHVFPCKPKGKKPLVPGWPDTATTNEQQIRRWWGQWPNANIGVVTGKKSGLAVLDIDPRHGGDDSLSHLEQQYGKLPDTPMVLTGGGGRHYYFAYRDGFKNSANQIGQGIDTRGDGGYVIAAPSIHENGTPYQWELSSDFMEISLAPPPDWITSGQIAKIHTNGTNGHANGNLNFTAGRVPHNGEPVAPGGRNNALASMAGQWIQNGDDFRSVLAKASEWNATNAVPLSTAEVNQTCASVAATHVKNNPAAVIPMESPAVEAVLFFDGPEAEPRRIERKWRQFPAELLKAPGVVGELVEWIVSTAPRPQPELALGNAIAFCGAVVGRMVATPTDLRTNFYCLGVAESGAGKDHSRQMIKTIVGATMDSSNSLLGGEDVSSDSAIIESVASVMRIGVKWPSCLFQFDEIGHMLSQASSKNSGNHQKAIPVTFTKLFSSASTLLMGKEYANRRERPRTDIDQPNVCIYGTTVPGRLASGLTPNEVRDGFLGRMLVFISSNPDAEAGGDDDAEKPPVPDSIVHWIRGWMEKKPTLAPGGNLKQTTVPERAVICPDARQVLKDFTNYTNEKKIAERSRLDGFDAVWARTAEHAKKLALLFAAGLGCDAVVVSKPIAEYACNLANHLTESLIAWAAEHVAENEQERATKRMLAIIRDKGQITGSALTRKTQWMDRRQRESVLSDLIESGQIEVINLSAQGSGKKPVRIIKATAE